MGAAAARRRTRFAIVVALIVILAVAGGLFVSCRATDGSKDPVSRRRETTSTSTTAPAAPGELPATPIEWSSCDGGECGRLVVPRDGTADPATAPGAGAPGATTELALFKAAARDPGGRIGTLLVNPGGPGSPGVALARGSSRFLPDSVSDRFDVIGWDPRGVGASDPVDCGEQLDYLFSGDTAPEDTAEWSALDDVSRRFADECASRSGPELLGNISTLATVHDMERIRRALGEEQVSFIGFSYGTELGALYATLYPDRVRAMVLDGAVDPSLSAAESVTQQSEGLERGLDEFFADCSRDAECPIRDDPGAVYDDVMATVEAAPLRVRESGEERLVTPALADIAVAAALYSESTWSDLQRALARASDGNGRGLLDLFDGYMRRDSDGNYGDEWPAFLAITCLDGPSLGGPGVYRAVEAAAGLRAPRFGAANVGLGLPCAYWSVPTAAPLPSVSAPTAAPIVVIGTRFDPITPLPWAESLVEELGGQARLVVYDGQGHTSFGSGSTCLDDPIAEYLVDLTVPPTGLTCGAG